MSAQERTGWRDEGLSARHRLWGRDCPAVDLDGVFIEFNHWQVTALVEYKNEHSGARLVGTTNILLPLIDLGNKAGIPVLGVRYASDFSWWEVTPLNQRAIELLASRTRMTEAEWVSWLFGIRGTSVPAQVLADISGAATSTSGWPMKNVDALNNNNQRTQ